MRYWDAGKPAAPWKEGKVGSSSGELPCGRGAMHPGKKGNEVVLVVSCPTEEEPCTPERGEMRWLQW